MSWHYHARCEKCELELEFRSYVIYTYRLDDGFEFSSPCLPIWCFQCQGIRTREVLPPVSSLLDKRRQLESEGIDLDELQQKADFLKQPIDPATELTRQLHAVNSQLQWLWSRVSSPRCLDCGDTNFVELASDFTDSPKQYHHPECGGVFELELRAHGSTSNRIVVGPEGERVY